MVENVVMIIPKAASTVVVYAAVYLVVRYFYVKIL